MDIVRLQNLTKSYGEKIDFRDVNLGATTGAFVVIRGESGAGKSTLLNIIGGLESASSGQVIVDAQDIMRLPAKERVNFYRNAVGIIFQGSYLQPELSLFENIALPGVFANMKVSEREERAQQLAEMLGIADVLEHLPKAVSGGQAERACIARALFLNPKIILADEPTSNLDPGNADAVLRILNDLRLNLGLTVITVSHSEDALRFATQVVTVSDGGVFNQIIDNQDRADDVSRNL